MNTRSLLSLLINAKIKQYKKDNKVSFYTIMAFYIMFGLALLPFLALPGYLILTFKSIIQFALGLGIFSMVGLLNAFAALSLVDKKEFLYLNTVTNIKRLTVYLITFVFERSILSHLCAFGVFLKISPLEQPIKSLVYLTVTYLLFSLIVFSVIKLKYKV